jgi:hypothetical protein
MFDRLIHADWSCDSAKRWMAGAERTPYGWQVDAPRRVPSNTEFLENCLQSDRSLLAGFDFPIGLPIAFGKRTEFVGYVQALQEFGAGDWKDFFKVADTPEDISLRRPFYPNTSRRGRKHNHVFGPLGVSSMDELRRECERKTAGNRPAACPIFWTLGGKQVGKAAIDGWQHVIRPALARGARLWPFHGRLDELSKLAGCVLCETYPREAYGHVGVVWAQHFSKRRQEDRRSAAKALAGWADDHCVEFAASAKRELWDGFGPKNSGEDSFDAFVGLLSMIEVVDCRRPEGGSSVPDEVARWEGWILGQRGS